MEVERGGGGRTDGDHTCVGEQETDHEYGGEPHELGQVEPAVEPRDQAYGAQGEVDRTPGPVGHLRQVAFVEPQCPYGRGAADALQQLLLLGADGHPVRGVQGGAAAQVPADGVPLDRDGEQGGQEEAVVEHGEADQGQPDDQHRAGQFGQRTAYRLGDGGDVVGDPRGEVAGAGLFQPPQRQVQCPVDELFPQVGEHSSPSRAIMPMPIAVATAWVSAMAISSTAGTVSAPTVPPSVTRSTMCPSSGGVSSPIAVAAASTPSDPTASARRPRSRCRTAAVVWAGLAIGSTCGVTGLPCQAFDIDRVLAPAGGGGHRTAAAGGSGEDRRAVALVVAYQVGVAPDDRFAVTVEQDHPVGDGEQGGAAGDQDRRTSGP